MPNLRSIYPTASMKVVKTKYFLGEFHVNQDKYWGEILNIGNACLYLDFNWNESQGKWIIKNSVIRLQTQFLSWLFLVLSKTKLKSAFGQKIKSASGRWLFLTSAEVLPWQLGIIPQLATIHEADTSTQLLESVCELGIDWYR